MEYSELYDKIQDVTNDVGLFCGMKQMTNPRQSKYEKELIEKMSSLATELSSVAHELNEHFAWDLISRNGERITVGAKVRWYGSEEKSGDLERIYIVDNICGEIVLISDEFSETEVLPSELEIIE